MDRTDEPRRLTVVRIRPAGIWQRVKAWLYSDLERGVVFGNIAWRMRRRWPVQTIKTREMVDESSWQT